MISVLCQDVAAETDRTFVEVALVEVVRAGNVHIVETCDLSGGSACALNERGRCGGTVVIRCGVLLHISSCYMPRLVLD